jgi:osmotically-inducible protein OsmY
MRQMKSLALILATASALGLGLMAAQAEVPPEDSERQLAAEAGDSATSEAVKSRLLWNQSTAGLAIEVSTTEGVVTLEGIIDAPEMRDLAGRLAAETNGVRLVDNRLVVRESPSAEPEGNDQRNAKALDDAWITGKVKSTLLLQQGLSGAGISVSTDDGHVNLSGEVGSAADKQQMEETARNVRGVRQVSTRGLRIES